jgi:hypothetical protein
MRFVRPKSAEQQGRLMQHRALPPRDEAFGGRRVREWVGAISPGAANAAEVHVMISAGFYGVYAELGPAFERGTGHRLVTTRGPSMEFALGSESIEAPHDS